jgi:hypothetical protein
MWGFGRKNENKNFGVICGFLPKTLVSAIRQARYVTSGDLVVNIPMKNKISTSLPIPRQEVISYK